MMGGDSPQSNIIRHIFASELSAPGAKTLIAAFSS